MLPAVSIAAFTIALAEFARVVGAGQGKHVFSVRQGWVAYELAGPGPCEPASALPAPYAPELQPAERLWPLTNEALANKHFHDLDALQEVQTPRCLALQALPHAIDAHTQFHWWPQSA